MTSSLVGSEMCIRDSEIHVGLWVLKTSGRHVAVCPDQTWISFHLSPGAVSYTHLTLPTICSV
eukprot:4539388-Prorocentrum_lima.AAC.1